MEEDKPGGTHSGGSGGSGGGGGRGSPGAAGNTPPTSPPQGNNGGVLHQLDARYKSRRWWRSRCCWWNKQVLDSDPQVLMVMVVLGSYVNPSYGRC
jgi:hypothetical protein